MGADRAGPGGEPAGPVSNPGAKPPRFRPTGRDDFSPGGQKAKARANIAAIRVLRALQAENRPATADEQAVLARYGSWGALPKMFTTDPEFEAERGQLRQLLNDDEWAAARNTTINAHYTDPDTVQAMWDALQELGFDGGRVLEPGSGAGTFIGFAPDGADMTGVELDPITAAISRALYPDAAIRNENFKKTRMPDGVFDAAVGNVPFSDYAPTDPRYNPLGLALHNYFIDKTLTMVKPGGLFAVLSSRYTMDAKGAGANGTTPARDEIAGKADFLGAVRLPNGSHSSIAGTDVIEDILVFRKRPEGEPPRGQAWAESTPQKLVARPKRGEARGETFQIPINQYFVRHPEQVVGTVRVEAGQYGKGELLVDKPDDGDIAGGVRDALARIVTQAKADGLTQAPQDPDSDGADLVVQYAPPWRHEGHIAEAEPGQVFTRTVRFGANGKPLAKARTETTEFTTVVDGVVVPFWEVDNKASAELRELLRLRDTALRLLDAEGSTTVGGATADLDSLRADLNGRYDAYVAAYGPVNRFEWLDTGRFKTAISPDTGEEVQTDEQLQRQVRPSLGGFAHDPQSAVVEALESYDPLSRTAKKADIFSRRVVEPRALITSADNPEDALAAVLEHHGEARLDQIAKLLGTDEATARQQLGTLVFDEPAGGTDIAGTAGAAFQQGASGFAAIDAAITEAVTGPEPGTATGRLIPAAEYLSGNVRVKLRAAEAAAAANPQFQANVDALRAAVPADLGPDRIKPRLGQSWIAPRYIRQFLKETLDDYDASVTYDQLNGWKVTGDHQSDKARISFGTNRRSALVLAQSLLNQSPIKVTDKVEIDGKEREVVNVAATLAAQAKAEEIAERFASWLFSEGNRADTLLRTYNDLYNAHRLRSYRGARRQMPGLSTKFKPHQHQHEAVERIVNEPGVLLAHEVGLGKTLEMAMGAMELRRLGLAKKPAIVIPNHMREQFTREFLEAYPQAKVLSVGSEDMAGRKRRRFVAKAATGDWDAIIITQEAFKRTTVSDETRQEYIKAELKPIQDRLDLLESLAPDAFGSDKEKQTAAVKRLVKRLNKAQEALEKRLAGPKDNAVSFEQTGIDYLMVDEAHHYKNLAVTSSIEGVSIPGSTQASDLHMKLHYLRKNTESGRVVTFATGTPIANSIAEAHTMLRFLRPDLLQEQDVEDFDRWAAQFGEVVVGTEISVDGTTFKQKARFARFNNLRGLLLAFHTTADIKTGEDAGLKRPDVVYVDPVTGARVNGIRTMTTERSGALADYVSDLAERTRDVENNDPRKFPNPNDPTKPIEDNKLKIAGDGRRAAVDLRLVGLVDPEDPTGEKGKLGDVADLVAGKYREYENDEYPLDPKDPAAGMHPTKGSLQFVFLDQGTPSGKTFNAYEDLRQKLAARGVPADKVRFIHEAKNDQEKAQMFAAARSGHIAVLVGSTEKMGTGVNAQFRARHLVHTDPTWKPAEMTQRDGRIERQGNWNGEVQITRAVTDRSFDTFSYQTLARKARGFGDFLSANLEMDEIEVSDDTLALAQITAINSGNLMLLEQHDLDAAVTKLGRLETGHNTSQDALRASIPVLQAKLDRAQAVVTEAQAAIGRREDVTGDKFRMVVAGREYTKRGEAAKALAAAARDDVYGQKVIGQFAGFDLQVTPRWNSNYKQQGYRVTMLGVPGSDMEFFDVEFFADTTSEGASQNLAALSRRVSSGLDFTVKTNTNDIETYTSKLAFARENVGKPYAKAALVQAGRRRKELVDQYISMGGGNRHDEATLSEEAKAELELLRAQLDALPTTAEITAGRAEPSAQPPPAAMPEEPAQDALAGLVAAGVITDPDTPEPAPLPGDPERTAADAAAPAAVDYLPVLGDQDRTVVAIDGGRLGEVIQEPDGTYSYQTDSRQHAGVDLPDRDTATAELTRAAAVEQTFTEALADAKAAYAADEAAAEPAGPRPKLPPKPAATGGVLNVLHDVADNTARQEDPARGGSAIGHHPRARDMAIAAGYVEQQDTGDDNADGGRFRLHLTDAGREQLAADDQRRTAEGLPAAGQVRTPPPGQPVPPPAPAGRAAQHVGQVGDRLDGMLATVTDIRPMRTRVGVSTLVTLRTADGDTLTWKAFYGPGFPNQYPPERDWGVGEQAAVSGTVERHSDGDDGPVTVLSGATLAKPGAPATPAEVAARPDPEDIGDENLETPAPAADPIPDITAGSGEIARGVTFRSLPHGLVIEGDTFPVKDIIKDTLPVRWRKVPGGGLDRRSQPVKAWTLEGATPQQRQDAITRLREALGTTESTVPEETSDFPPTEQQQAVIDAVRSGEDVVVRALAGTGKTTTLRLIAERMHTEQPGRRVVYVAFNKAIQVEASQRMPKNVEARTGDSLAYRAVPRYVQQRLGAKDALRRPDDIARHLGVTADLVVAGHGGVSPTEQVAAALRAVEQYAISADDDITAKHFGLSPETASVLLPVAQRVWADIQAEDGRLRVTNSHITKMWALTRPDLTDRTSGVNTPADVVFFDEAQDINPVMAKVIAAQRIQKVYVGDSNQAINGFRGAVDELDHVEVDHDLPLTKSWRFGPQVADMGNRYLQLLEAPHRVEGGGADSTILKPGTMTDPDAILVRSNAGAVSAIGGWQNLGKIVGVPKGTKGDLRKLVDTVRWLQGEGRQPASLHEDLAAYRTWAEVKRAEEQGDDAKLSMLVRIVDSKPLAELDHMVDQLVDAGDKDDRRTPDMVVSTAHKAKGLEWERVQIGDDFRGPKNVSGKTVMPDPEELRLAYVAVTRARKELDPGSLDWVRRYTDVDGGEPGSSPPDPAKAVWAGADMPAGDIPAAELPEMAGFTAVERGQIELAVADYAGRYARLDPARYITDGHLQAINQVHGSVATQAAVQAYLDANPDAAKGQSYTEEQVAARRADRAASAGRLAGEVAAAVKAGDFAQARDLVDQAEILDPTKADTYRRVRDLITVNETNARAGGPPLQEGAAGPGDAAAVPTPPTAGTPETSPETAAPEPAAPEPATPEPATPETATPGPAQPPTPAGAADQSAFQPGERVTAQGIPGATVVRTEPDGRVWIRDDADGREYDLPDYALTRTPNAEQPAAGEPGGVPELANYQAAADWIAGHVNADKTTTRDIRLAMLAEASNRTHQAKQRLAANPDAAAMVAVLAPLTYRRGAWDSDRARAALARVIAHDPTLPANTVGHRVRIDVLDMDAPIRYGQPAAQKPLEGVVRDVHSSGTFGDIMVVVVGDDGQTGVETFRADGAVTVLDPDAAVPAPPQPEPAAPQPDTPPVLDADRVTAEKPPQEVAAGDTVAVPDVDGGTDVVEVTERPAAEPPQAPQAAAIPTGSAAAEVLDRARPALDGEDEQRVRYYTGDGFSELSRRSRSGDMDTADRNALAAMTDIIGRSRVDADVVVYRGAADLPAGLDTSQPLVGQEYTDAGLVSATTSTDVARTYAGVAGQPTVIRILVRRGDAALLTGNASDNPGEAEVVLQPGRKYKVIREGSTRGLYGTTARVLDVEMVPEPGQAAEPAAGEPAQAPPSAAAVLPPADLRPGDHVNLPGVDGPVTVIGADTAANGRVVIRYRGQNGKADVTSVLPGQDTVTRAAGEPGTAGEPPRVEEAPPVGVPAVVRHEDGTETAVELPPDVPVTTVAPEPASGAAGPQEPSPPAVRVRKPRAARAAATGPREPRPRKPRARRPAPREIDTTGDTAAAAVAPGDRLTDTEGGELLVLGVTVPRAGGQRKLMMVDVNGRRVSQILPDDGQVTVSSAAAAPDPLPDGAEAALPPVAVYQRRTLVALDLESSPDASLAQAAARVRAKLPITREQADRLAAELAGRAGSAKTPAQQRSLARFAAQVGATGHELGGAVPPAVPGRDTVIRSAAPDLALGDTVAVAGLDPEPVVGQLIASRRLMGGRLHEITVDTGPTQRTYLVTRSAPVYVLPDQPDPVPVPDPAVDGAAPAGPAAEAVTGSAEDAAVRTTARKLRSGLAHWAANSVQMAMLDGRYDGLNRATVLADLADPATRAKMVDAPLPDSELRVAADWITGDPYHSARPAAEDWAGVQVRAHRVSYYDRVVAGLQGWPDDDHTALPAVVQATPREYGGDLTQYEGVIRAARSLQGNAEDVPDQPAPTPEPTGTLPEQIAAFRAALPDDLANVGKRRMRRQTFAPVPLSTLDAGQVPDLVETEYLAPDWPDGDVTSRHHAVVHAAGRAVAAEIDRRAADTTPAARAAAALQVLGELVPLAGDGDLLVSGGSSPAVLDALEAAGRYFPRAWVTSAPMLAGFTAPTDRRGQRGRYERHPDGTADVTVAALAPAVDGRGDLDRSAVHGLAHHLEDTVPGLRAAVTGEAEIRGQAAVAAEGGWTANRRLPDGRTARVGFEDLATGMFDQRNFRYPEVFPAAAEHALTGAGVDDPYLREWFYGVVALLGAADTAAPDGPPTPPAGPAPLLPDDLTAVSDDRLVDLVSDPRVAADEAALQRVLDELDRRDADTSDLAAAAVPESIPDEAALKAAVAAYSARVDAIDAELAAAGVPEDVIDPAPRRLTGQQVRDDYENWLNLTVLDAEQATRGNLLSRAGQAAEASVYDLFTGSSARSIRYASEELIRWWQEDPSRRQSFPEWRHAATGSGAKAARVSRYAFTNQMGRWEDVQRGRR